MTRRLYVLLAGSSILAITSTINAYAAQPTPIGSQQQLAAADEVSGTEEIIVTARRKAENLQDVPETVNAVTATQLQQLNLQDFQDIVKVLPGLTLQPTGNEGNTPTIALRGATFAPAAAGENIIAFYLNDSFTLPNIVLNDIYDVGQIELERGPQGTLRGESAPAGSIAETTHRPDLERFGGYATGTITQYGNMNLNGAVNVPIVQDKLAIRAAGLVDMNNNGGIESINNPAKPFSHTYSGRLSVRFEPNDNISANLMYQHLYNRQQLYGGVGGTQGQVFGTGSPGGGTANTPANYNGGTITPTERLSPGYLPSGDALQDDMFTANLSYKFKGQLLEYIGSWSQYKPEPGGFYPSSIPGIPAAAINPVPGDPLPGDVDINYSHEIRLSSDEPDRFWDYAVGGYFRRQYGRVSSYAPLTSDTFEPGAFGPPGSTPNLTTFNPIFVQQVDQAFNHTPQQDYTETSAYAHLTFHLPGSNELALGGRYIHYKKFQQQELVDEATNYAATTTSAGATITPALCAAGGYTLPNRSVAGPGVYGNPYAGVCTASIPASVAIVFHVADARYNAAIYSATLSHKFNDDVMAYFNSGSSWRPGAVSIGVQNAIGDPALLSLGNNPPERSYNFEGGLKTSFDDKRGRLNLTYFHQIYDNYVYSGSAVTYLASITPTFLLPLTYPFNSHPNAVMDGIEAEGGYQVTKDLNLSASATWTHSSISGTVPCNPPTGFPNFTNANFPAGTYVFFCPGKGAANPDPKFEAQAEAEYRKPITGDIEGFIRGQMQFKGVDPNCNTCSGRVSGSTFVLPAYQISNIFIGIRSSDGAWEGSIFAKNVTNTQQILTNINKSQISNVNLTLDPIFGNSGYYAVTTTPPREFGLTVTYAFGSR